MKKLILFFLSSIAFAKLNILVSIIPEEIILKNIAKEKVNISTIVKPGFSPHTYEPKPSQMINISKADIYLSIGVEFEKIWLNKFKSQNKNLKIFNLSKNINKINNNPHIWASIKNTKIIAKNILNILKKYDKENKEFYIKNYNNFITKLNYIDNKIKTNIKQKYFLTIHPAWIYFAKDYNIYQIPVKINGKSPTIKNLINIIKLSKKYNIKTLVTSPEFSDKGAKIIAKEANLKIIKLSPLINWPNNLIKLSNALK